ncbi:hypothetical protein [Klebsiella pneumoniae]|uniref:hypothetical protein n=1 Tax=Klebsiella pneumoniae TaxID=573 RepID=UPI00388EDB67
MLTGPVTILCFSSPSQDINRETIAANLRWLRDGMADPGGGRDRHQHPIVDGAARRDFTAGAATGITYPRWGVEAFRLNAAVARASRARSALPCASEFNDIMDSICRAGHDVITVKPRGRCLGLLESVPAFSTLAGIGPGI